MLDAPAFITGRGLTRITCDMVVLQPIRFVPVTEYNEALVGLTVIDVPGWLPGLQV